MGARPDRITHRVDPGDGDALRHGDILLQGKVRMSAPNRHEDASGRKAGSGRPSGVNGTADRHVRVAKRTHVANASEPGLKHEPRVMGTPECSLGDGGECRDAEEVGITRIEREMDMQVDQAGQEPPASCIDCHRAGTTWQRRCMWGRLGTYPCDGVPVQVNGVSRPGR